MGDQVQFDFAVPDELLAEVVARSSTPEYVADLAVMPGTGEGRPPPLTGILRRYGYAPLVLLTAAAVVPDTFGNGISLIGNNLEHSFHIHDAALGAMVFVASVAQLLWAVPLALWADRGSRKVVAAVSLLVFSVVAPFMALAPNIWAFTFLYLVASVGFNVSETVHNSYLSDAYPTEGRGRIFSWHNLSDPISLTLGILLFGLVVTVGHSWRWGMLIALVGIPVALSLFTLREPEKGQNESSHILKASGMDVHTQQDQAPRVLLGSAVTRLLRIRSIYYELVAVAILGFAGTGGPLFGNLYFARRWGLDTAQRSEVYSIIGLAAFVGTPGGLRDRRPDVPSVARAPAGRRRHLHRRLRGALRHVALPPRAVDGGGRPAPGHGGHLPAGHLHLPHAGRHGAAGDADDLLRPLRGVGPRLRWVRRRRAPRGGQRRGGLPARSDRGPHRHRAGLRDRRSHAPGRLPLRAAGHHHGHRGRPRAPRRGAPPPVRRPCARPCRSTTSTSTTGPTRCSSTSTSTWPKGR